MAEHELSKITAAQIRNVFTQYTLQDLLELQHVGNATEIDHPS
jgi:hypothetical protein